MITEDLMWIATAVTRQLGHGLKHHDREDLEGELLLSLVEFSATRDLGLGLEDRIISDCFAYLRIAGRRWWRTFSKRPFPMEHTDQPVEDKGQLSVDLTDSLARCCNSKDQVDVLGLTMHGYSTQEIALLTAKTPQAVTNMRAKVYRRVRRRFRAEGA